MKWRVDAMLIEINLWERDGKMFSVMTTFIALADSNDSWTMPLEDEESGHSGTVIGFEEMSEVEDFSHNDPDYSRRISVSLDQNGDRDEVELEPLGHTKACAPEKVRESAWPNIKGRRRLLKLRTSLLLPQWVSLEEIDVVGPISYELELLASLGVQGTMLLAPREALITSKANSKPLGKLLSTEPPHVIAEKRFYDIFRACLGFAYAMENEHKKVLEFADCVHLPRKELLMQRTRSSSSPRGRSGDPRTKVAANIALFDGYFFDVVYNSSSANRGATSLNREAFRENKVEFLSS
uniref:Uncharacterized protein n=1 Tax=Cannabis sativa TaxID=3483 RepID=A0A803PHP4_CANSA